MAKEDPEQGLDERALADLCAGFLFHGSSSEGRSRFTVVLKYTPRRQNEGRQV